MSPENPEPDEPFKKKKKLWINNSTKPIPYRTRQRRGSVNLEFDHNEHSDGSEGRETIFEVACSTVNISRSSSISNASMTINNEQTVGMDSDEDSSGNFIDAVDTGSIHSDESDSDDDYDYYDKIIINNDDDVLYAGSDVTVIDIVSDLMDLYTQHKITKTALKCILKLLQKVLPKKNYLPPTLHRLFQFVEKKVPTSSAKKHYFCKICTAYCESGDEAFCSCCKMKQQTGVFYELDILEQIKFLFEHRNLADKLKPFQLTNNNVITDISDGSEYKRVNSSLSRQPYDLTLILNTDGLALVKSAKSHCWPLLFTIAELPIHLRQYFLITIGLWYDDNIKPLMSTFLHPFSIKFRQVFDKGIDWVHPITKICYNSKIVVPVISADAPARADLLNMLNHNGEYGCNICEFQTQPSRKIIKKRRARVYTYTDKTIPLRCEERMIQQAEVAQKLRTSGNSKKANIHSFGIKGLTILCLFPLLKISTCVVPEYMHSVLLGVVKQFLKLWIEKNGIWNIKKFKIEIESLLANIRPPSHFHRMPRSIFFYHFFKAHEFYNWILFYSIPVLADKLPKKYLQHWILLVIAIFKLLQNEITPGDLEQADICLRLFVRDIGELYNDREYTYNVHQLLHLVLSVRRWGPLWALSAFPFENYNGFLRNSIHGTKNQGLEMIKNLRIAQAARVIKKLSNESKADREEYVLLGAVCERQNCIGMREKIILNSKNIKIEDILLYSRASIKGKIFSSQLYKITKTDNSLVKIEVNDCTKYGSIKFFFKTADNIFIMFQRLVIKPEEMFVHEETNLKVEHILPFEMGNEFFLCKMDEIKQIVHLINIGKFVCDQPNQFSTVV